MPSKCTEGINSYCLTDKETKYADLTYKDKAVSFGIPAGYRYLTTNQMDHREDHRPVRTRKNEEEIGAVEKIKKKGFRGRIFEKNRHGWN